MPEMPRSLPKVHSAPPSPRSTSALHREPNRRISLTFGLPLPQATQVSLFTLPPPVTAELAEHRESDRVHEEGRRSNTPSGQQASCIASASQDLDPHSTSERGQLYTSEQSIDTGFPANSSRFPVSAPTQRASEASLRTMPASQSSDLQSTSESPQLQSIDTNFIVTTPCVPVSTPTQPGAPRQDGVATSSDLLLNPESIHPDDICRQHHENCNELAFKVNNLHSDLSQS